MGARPSRFRQGDVTKLVKGLVNGGLPVGSFKIVVDDNGLTVLPIGLADAPPASSDVKRALEKWRRSA